MVLTAAMVGSVYAIYRLREKRVNWLWAILLLSVATLTKGPVGTLLPCLAMGLYFLLRGDNFWRTLLVMTVLCLASFILPLLWYYAAWHQGGDNFITLAYEENIGRITGTMSYDSHVNPWWYNITSVLAGMLPWTIFALVGLCYRRIRSLIRTIKLDRGLPLMAWTVSLTIFIFYCIPESKRSVYLLPCYPFMAYGTAWVISRMRNTRFMHISGVIFSLLAVVAPIVLIVASLVYPASLRLTPMPWWRWPFALIPAIVGLWWLLTRRRGSNPISCVVLMVYSMFLAYNAAFAPMVLNAKSDRLAAEAIAAKTAGAKVYGIITDDRLLRYYTINYYLGDRVRPASNLDSVPAGAWVIAGEIPQGVLGDTLTRRSCDTRRPVILFQAPASYDVSESPSPDKKR